MDELRFGYVRVSKANDEGGNLETQRRVLASRDVPAGLIFTDTCRGTVPPNNRPGWSDLMGRMTGGDTLVIKHPDRLARNALDGLMMLRDLAEREINVVVVDFGGGTGNPDVDRLMIQQALVWAEWFARDTSRRIKEGHERARAQGKKVGRPGRENSDFLKEQAQRMDANGINPSEIARRLGELGEPLPRSTVRRWLGKL